MKLVIIISIAFVLLFVPSTVLADTQYRTTSVSALVDFGALDIKADYDLGFDIIVPSVIEAGDTVSITIVPSSSIVTSTITLSGSRIGTFPTDLVYGQEETFGIPGGFGVGAFATSTAYVLPTVSGPAHIVSNDWIYLKDARAKTFQVSVNDDIGRYDSVTLKFEILLDTTIGANLDLVLFSQKLASETFRLEPTYQMPVKIPLHKIYNTNLSLDVKDGTCAGCIKVKPTLTYDGSKTLHSSQIIIYVDGKISESGLTSNQWSWNFSPGTGSHSFKAEFLGDRSSSNKAIFYSQSSDSESFIVKTTSSSSSSQQSNTKNSLSCGTGTHEENGQCVANSFLEGLTWFFDDLMKQLNNLFKWD